MPERGEPNRFRMEALPDQFLTLPTSIHISMDCYGYNIQDFHYELLFFPNTKYSRTHIFQDLHDDIYEQASRSGVPDLELKVNKIKNNINIELMTMTFDNPSVGLPRFTYRQPSLLGGGHAEYQFDENEFQTYNIAASNLGPCSVSVKRLADDYPGGYPPTSKIWQVVIHNYHHYI